MITVPEIVEQIVRESPFLEEALASKIINLSSLARQIQPLLKQRLLKDTKEGAIVMALKRLEEKLDKSQSPSLRILSNLGDLTIRSNLVEITFTNSTTLLDRVREILLQVDREKSSFVTFTHGVFETTLIVSHNLEEEIEKIFSQEHMRSKFTQLSAITVILPKETVETPGAYYQILKTLAWENINIIEVVSNFTELTIILEEKQVNRAFSALKELD